MNDPLPPIQCCENDWKVKITPISNNIANWGNGGGKHTSRFQKGEKSHYFCTRLSELTDVEDRLYKGMYAVSDREWIIYTAHYRICKVKN